MTVPEYQKQQINTNVQYGSGGSNTLMNVASATDRLAGRLAGSADTVARFAEPKITEETINKALQDVKEGKVDSDNVSLVARDVYRKTAHSAFIADTEVSGNELGLNIIKGQEALNKYDINAFTKSWDAYTKSTLSGITDPDIKQSVASKLAKRGQLFGSQIVTLQTKQQREIQNGNFEAKLAMDTESLNAAFGTNPEEAIRLQEEIDNTLQVMVGSNLIAPNMALLKRKQIAKGAYLTNMQRQLTTAINSGDAYKFYKDFKNMDHQGILSPADIETFRQSIQSQISTDVKVYNNELQAQETQFKMTELETTNEFNEMLIQGELTTDAIDNALATNRIDVATHKTYTDKLQVKDKLIEDTSKVLMFQAHILDFTEDEIISSPHLKNSTKWDLIKQRRSEQSDEANWLSSQSGKEARDRIKRTFNIIEGTMMAQMDFNNKNMQDYDELYRNFYAEVESLPFDQRASKSISIADKYIKEYKAGKEEATRIRREQREAKKREDEKKAESTYGSTTGKFMNMLEDKWNSATKVWEDME